ncbi:MAG: MSHA biogenesis protein MshQ [Aliivibrio sp.]|nr:MSHA biogenesis protein MshQ [Aliivibrio sp.]
MKQYQSVGLLFLLMWSTLLFSAEKPLFMDKNTTLSTSVCDLFPNTVQSWQGNQNNFFQVVLSDFFNETAYIQLLDGGKVGFTNTIINGYSDPLYTPENQKRSSRCNDNDTVCDLNGDVAPVYNANFIDTVPSDVHIINDLIPIVDVTYNQSTYFKSAYSSTHNTIALRVSKGRTVTFKEGEYWFDSVEIAQNGKIIADGNVIFHLKDQLRVDGEIRQQQDSSLIIYSYRKEGCPKPNNYPDGIPDIFWLPSLTNFGLDYQRVFLENNAVVEAHIYAQGPLLLSSGSQVIGSVTACQIKMNKDSKIIGRRLQNCDSSNYQLVISPTSGKGLACDGIEIDFSLVDSDGNVVEGKGQQLQVTSNPVAVGDRNSACWSDDGNITASECNHSNDSRFDTVFPSSGPAVVTRYIHSKFLNSYNVSASVSSDNLTTTAGPYQFIAKAISIVPSEGVDGSDSNQVAGRPYPFRLKIRGKENENGNMLNCHIIKETADIDVTFSNSVLPVTSNKNIEISQEGSSWTGANKTLSVAFVNGVAGGDESQADGSLKARLNDAGKARLTVSANIQGKAFTTSEQFYYRPFTAALCGKSSVLPYYTDELNGAYLASGSDFNAYLKAVNWIKGLDSGLYGDGIPDYDNPSLVCSKSVTPSYITHSEGMAQLSLAAQLNYPLSGVIGVISADGHPIANFSKEVTSENKNASTTMNWNEVGTLGFDVFQNNYFNRSGFTIPSTFSKVGRFYPAYFSITNTEWDYPEEQGSTDGAYVYMGQHFTNVDFQVMSYSASDTNTINYGRFDESLKAWFSLVGDHAVRLNITDTDLDASHWGNGALWHVNNLNDAVIWSRLSDSTLAGSVTTKPDGPFNMSNNAQSIKTELGLEISGVDPVSFDTSSFDPTVIKQELLSQPDTRYGRMVLDSVGTAVGQSMSVPLRVEYWSGNAFVLSNTDNASKFEGEKHCKQTVWPDQTQSTNVILKGSNTVIQGSDVTHLIADASNSTLREQVRFWLRLASTSSQIGEANVDCESDYLDQPWLQFNWRGQGDEDPSTVVTFGIYRGNDRVIFRGESNIIGTSN